MAETPITAEQQQLNQEFFDKGFPAEQDPKQPHILLLRNVHTSSVTGEFVESVAEHAKEQGTEKVFYEYSRWMQPYIDAEKAGVITEVQLADYMARHNSPTSTNTESTMAEAHAIAALHKAGIDVVCYDARTVTTQDGKDFENKEEFLAMHPHYSTPEGKWELYTESRDLQRQLEAKGKASPYIASQVAEDRMISEAFENGQHVKADAISAAIIATHLEPGERSMVWAGASHASGMNRADLGVQGVLDEALEANGIGVTDAQIFNADVVQQTKEIYASEFGGYDAWLKENNIPLDDEGHPGFGNQQTASSLNVPISDKGLDLMLDKDKGEIIAHPENSPLDVSVPGYDLKQRDIKNLVMAPELRELVAEAATGLHAGGVSNEHAVNAPEHGVKLKLNPSAAVAADQSPMR